jgi:hypothetical protein
MFCEYGGKDHATKPMAEVRELPELVEKLKKLAASGKINVVDGFLADQ